MEKNPLAPLICAALSQPVLEVNKLKAELLVSEEIVMPTAGEAAFDSDPAVKSKFARVAA